MDSQSSERRWTVAQIVIGTLLTLMATAFLAWAGVVWKAAMIARETAERLNNTLDVIESRISRLESKTAELDRDLRDHASGGPHPGVKELYDSLRRDVDRLERIR